MSSASKAQPAFQGIKLHPEIGLWSLYFLGKGLLFYRGTIEFDVLLNGLLLVALLIKLPNAVNVLRHVVLVPFAAWLAYEDSYLPPFSRMLDNQALLEQFSFNYMLELAGRFISPDQWLMIGGTIAAFVVLNKWVRFTSFAIVAYGVMAMSQLSLFQTPSTPPLVATAPLATTQTQSTAGSAELTLDQRLEQFYQTQSALKTEFPSRFNGAPFDVILLNVCSLSWQDLTVAGLVNHPLFDRFDVTFKQFNAATTYSGPAAVRLLRASCGQPTHDELYVNNPPKQCFIMENLAELGFATDFAMNHTGFFDDFSGLIRDKGMVSEKPLSLANVDVAQYAFDGSPVYRDRSLFNKWLDKSNETQQNRVLYYNTISLHDGNRIVGRTSQRDSVASYVPRAEMLFNDILNFVAQLEQQGRNAMVVMVPEHGAALKGDKMQIVGMREIPNSQNTHIPVGVMFTGKNATNLSKQVVTSPSSYLAISELVARALRFNSFESGIDLPFLTKDLPQQAFVAENQGIKMQLIDGKPYIKLDDEEWVLYPGFDG